jgi:predicted nicotinamide N-methyase
VVEQTVTVGDVTLLLLRPADPEALIDDDAFAERDEFLPYWAELWPAGLELAEALPRELPGVRVVELGAGLGVPSLVAAARGAEVTAVDWAPEAVELLQENAARNGLRLTAVAADWRDFDGSFDLALAADVLYEERNVDALLAALPRLAPEVLLADPGRPHAGAFLARVQADRIAERVYRVRTIA